MGAFLAHAQEELYNQKRLLKLSEKVLTKEPEGYLKSRPRKEGCAFYVQTQSNGKIKAQNITKDYKHIEKLSLKRVYQEIQRSALHNIALLEQLCMKYRENEFCEVLNGLPDTYRTAFNYISMEKNRRRKQGTPIQRDFDPERHIHETLCGLKVRSKSEVIIANALTGYGIPFDYERPFPYLNNRGFYYAPDFTFDLPDGQTWIWEHFGMLKDENYSIHTAEKLSFYQKHGYLIGKNFIVTQDDERGNCSSVFIDQTIQRNLLPYFR